LRSLSVRVELFPPKRSRPYLTSTPARPEIFPWAAYQGPDGNHYGTTAEGGINQAGGVFKITPRGELSVLYLFSGPDGAEPNGSLTLGDHGEL
jgi:uncharacterized repeat protein (TIGR03803 family)